MGGTCNSSRQGVHFPLEYELVYLFAHDSQMGRAKSKIQERKINSNSTPQQTIEKFPTVVNSSDCVLFDKVAEFLTRDQWSTSLT